MNLYKGFNDFITLCSNFFHDYKMYIYIDLYLYASLLYCYHLLGQRAEYVLLLSKAGLFFYKISFYLQKICYTKEKKNDQNSWQSLLWGVQVFLQCNYSHITLYSLFSLFSFVEFLFLFLEWFIFIPFISID